MVEGVGTLLVLPDGRVVLQRRTKDAPSNPGLLGLFGGGVEKGENLEEAVLRELGEESNLTVSELRPEYKADITAYETRINREVDTAIFLVPIKSDKFEVYEGDRAETYTLAELRTRQDLTNTAKTALEEVFGGSYGS